MLLGYGVWGTGHGLTAPVPGTFRFSLDFPFSLDFSLLATASWNLGFGRDPGPLVWLTGGGCRGRVPDLQRAKNAPIVGDYVVEVRRSGDATLMGFLQIPYRLLAQTTHILHGIGGVKVRLLGSVPGLVPSPRRCNGPRFLSPEVLVAFVQTI